MEKRTGNSVGKINSYYLILPVKSRGQASHTLRRTPKLETQFQGERILGIKFSDEQEERLKVFAGSRDRRRWFATFLQAHEEDARVFVGAIPQLLQLGRHLDDEVGEETVDDALEEFIAWKQKWKRVSRQFSARPILYSRSVPSPPSIRRLP